MRLNTPTKDLTNEDLLKISEKALFWCHNKFGINPKKRTAVKLVVCPFFGTTYGEYCYKQNTIFIYKDNHKDIKEFIRTIIHEYTHYLQPIRKYYHVVEKITGYKNNPYEQEAYRNEDLFYKNCWVYIKKFF